MTTTPTIWKPAFYPYTAALAGIQSVPQTIGLANGNILVVWQDNAEPTRPFTDIIGQILSPEGLAIGPVFQVNAAIWGGDETGPKIVALPDGGFVMAYGGYFEALGGFITVERFDASGQSVFNNLITDPLSSLTNWDIVADSTGNYTVAFERLTGSIDTHSITYDHLTNARGPELSNVAQNSGETDRLGAIATFATGHILTFSTEPDFNLFGLDANTAEFTIVDPVTGIQLRNVEIDGDPPYVEAVARDVAVLTGGQFVLVYNYNPGSSDYKNDTCVFRVGLGEDGSLGPRIEIPATFAMGGVHIVALQDGGFFIAWHETTSHTLYGQRYGTYGDAIGAHFPFATNVASFATDDLGLTSDGRILATFRLLSNEVAEVLLDPRDEVISGTASADVITTQITSTRIFGLGGADTILGQGGDDEIDGGADFDILRGGKGNDTFYLRDVTANGDFDQVIELAGGGRDTVNVTADGLDSNILYSYSLTENVEAGVVTGLAGLDLVGNASANRLIGNSSTNYFFGLGGNDYLNGGGGADVLFGGEGNDTYVLGDTTGSMAFLSYDTVVENADSGIDSVEVYSGVPNLGSYTLSENVENGTITGSSNFDLRGNERNNRLIGNSAANTLDGMNGNDLLNGAGGSDVMLGGAGNDNYITDGGDTITENASQGTDTVQSSVSFVLGANLENLILTGSGAINGTGNTLANRLIGNAGNNVLNGGLGNDTMIGGAGNDTFVVNAAGDRVFETTTTASLIDAGGIDTIRSAVTFNLDADAGVRYVERLTMTGTAAINGTGNALANTLTGNAGKNVLNGGAGNDTLLGGAGNDTYVVGSAGDRVFETTTTASLIDAGGIDTVRSAVAFNLNANAGVRFVERLALTGTSAINGTGNALANILTGNAGNNVLNGGLGNDRMLGGAGGDTFVFIAAFGNDTINDFDRSQAGEVIDISAISAIVDFADLVANHLTQSGANAVITAGANSITLTGVLATTLLADDFIF